MLNLSLSMYEEYTVDVSKGFEALKNLKDNKNQPVITPDYIDDQTIEELNLMIQGCQRAIVEFPYFDREYLSSYYGHWSERFKTFSKKSYRILFFADNSLEKFMGYITLNPTFSKHHVGRMYFAPQYLIQGKARLILSGCKVHFREKEESLSYFPALRQIDPCVCAHVAVWGIIKYKSRWHEYAEKTSFEIENNIPKEWVINRLLNGVSVSQMAQILYEQRNYPVIKHISETYSYDSLFEEIFAYVQSKTPVILMSDKIDHAVVCMGYGSFRNAKKMIQDKIVYQMYNGVDKDQSNDLLLVHASELVNSFFVNDDLFFPYREIAIGIHEIEIEQRREKLDGLQQIELNKENKDASLDVAIKTGSDLSGLIAPVYEKIKLNYDFAKSIFLDLINENGMEFGWVKCREDSTVACIYNLFLTSCHTFRQQLMRLIMNESKAFWKTIYEELYKVELSRFVWVCEIAYPEEFNKNYVHGFAILDSTATLGDAAVPLIIFGPKKMTYYDDKEYKEKDIDPPETEEFSAITHFTNDLTNIN